MNLVGDPAAINAMASLLDARADHVVTCGRRAQAQADRSRWQCQKANRFRLALAHDRQEADRIAGEMHGLAQRMRRVAVEVQNELNVLHSLEVRVRNLFDGWVSSPGVDPPWVGTNWRPWNLPTSGDPVWRDVASVLRA
jgi:hypothetical protein